MLRETTIKIKENSYKIKPTIGCIVDFESFKAILSKGMYGDILRSRTIDSEFALNLIDTEAALNAFCPDAIRDIEKKVKSFRELSIEDSLELKDVYLEQILPMIKEIRKIAAPKDTIEQNEV